MGPSAPLAPSYTHFGRRSRALELGLNLPHQYPFQFVERVDGGHVVLRASAGGRFVEPSGTVPQVLTLEMLAQASFYLVPEEGAAGGALALAGVENARFGERLRAGDEVSASAELVARFGPLVRLKARLETEEALIVEADFLLAKGKS